jgi:hypothetical protein
VTRSFPRLTGRQLNAFADALFAAFTADEMKMLLQMRLGQSYGSIASNSDSFDSALAKIVEKADKFGWAGDLLREARRWHGDRSDGLIEFEGSLQLEENRPGGQAEA